MSALTAKLIKKAFQSGDSRQKNILVDKTEILQLCASFQKVAEGEYTELQNKVEVLYHKLLVNEEAFDAIKEAWDWEGPAVDIIEKAFIGSYGEFPTIFERAKALESLANNSPQSFKINNNMIIDFCQAHEEAEEKTFENLKYSISRYEKDIEIHHATFLKIKDVVDEFSESGRITSNALKFLDSNK